MANNKKRVLSLLMAAVMMLGMLPMNAFAAGSEDRGTLICGKQEVSHTAECYVHTADCYHNHKYTVLGMTYNCGYECKEHTHSVDNGCPTENCDAHAHGEGCTCDTPLHDHSASCYGCTKKHTHLVFNCNIQPICGGHTEHNAECCTISTDHTHSKECFSCTTEEHSHKDACPRDCGLTTESIDPVKCNDATLYLHSVDCKNEEHHTHSAACYMPADAVKDAFYRATGVEIQSAAEIADVLSTILTCKTGCGYKIISVLPEFQVEMQLCAEHFCDVCRRLNNGYCNCVEITFANIGNVPENTKTVKVKNGETVPADQIPADTFAKDYEFLGWFDENGNEFNAAAVYTADITFTASYRALGEVEKIWNAVDFIRNNFDLGTEIGRFITMITNGEVTKEKVLNEKGAAVATVTAALLSSVVTGQLTMEQAKEIGEMMNQGDEYVVMVAEWLWPEDAVEMPNLEEILANIDREKLAAEIKDMIAEYYGVEFTEEWINENRALAEQYIIECLREVKSITEQQKAALLEQIAQEKAEAREFINNLVSEIRAQVKAEIENAKDYVKAVLADREKGLKIGKAMAMITGLNNEKASEKGVLVKAALVSAIRMSGLDQKSQDAIIALMNSGDNGVVQVINWLWPVYTVNFVVDGTVVESDIAEHGTMPSFDGAEPTKTADAQYTYTFNGWNAEFTPVTGSVNYVAVFSETVNEYTVTFKNEDGTVLDTQTVAYGATPVYAGATPEKAADAQYTYTFNGWDAVIAPVTGDAVYTATFSTSNNEYTVTVMSDGKEIAKESFAYGSTVTADIAPATSMYKEGYDCIGWKDNNGNDVTFPITVTGDVTIEAVWQIKTFTVTWKNIDGTVLEVDENVPYGSATEYNGETPSYNPGDEYNYTFVAFNGTTTEVTGDMTITAAYTKELKQYNVKIVNAPGYNQIIQVRHGETIVLPFDQPTRTGYYCAGWYHYRVQDPKKDRFDFDTPVTGDMELSPIWEYTYADHNVTFFVAVDGVRTELGNGSILNFRHPKTFGYATVDAKDYSNATIVMPESYPDITIGGITYTYGEGSGRNFYTVSGVKKLSVVKVDTGSKYAFEGECEIKLFHTITFNTPVGTPVYVVAGHGEKLQEFWAEGYCFAYEVVNYWYDGKTNEKLDFNTFVVTKSGSFSCKTKKNIGDWNVALTATYGDETFNMGTAMLMDSEHAGNYRNNKQNIPYDETKMIMPDEFGALEIGDTTYYADSTMADFYTVDFNNLTCVSHKVGNKVKDWSYEFLGEIELFHTVTFVVDGKETKVTMAHGEKLDTTAVADQMVKRGFDLVWTKDEGGETFDTESAINESMTLEAKWVVKKVDAKLRIFVGFGESGTDKTANWKEAGTGKIFGANVCESYKNWGKSSTIMQEGEYSSYTGTAGSVVFDGTKYYNGTDEASRIGGDFYVIKSETLVACKSEYHLDCYAEFYHSVVFNVDGQYISVPVMHGHAVEVPAEYKNLKWNIDLTNITSTVMATPVY